MNRPRDSFVTSRALIDSLPFPAAILNDHHEVVVSNTGMEERLDVAEQHPCGPCCVKRCKPWRPATKCLLEEVMQSGVPGFRECLSSDGASGCMISILPIERSDTVDQTLFLHLAQEINNEPLLVEELKRERDHYQALSRLMSNLQECGSVLDAMVEFARFTLSIPWMGVETRVAGFLVRDDRLEMAFARNLPPEIAQGCARLAMGECVCGTAAKTARPVIVSNGDLSHGAFGHKGLGDHGHAALPLIHMDRVLGVLNFYLPPGCSLSHTQQAFLEAASAVVAAALAEHQAKAVAVETAERMESLRRKLLEQVINSQEEERRRISRELHDELGQDLSTLLVEIDMLLASPSAAEVVLPIRDSIKSVVDKVSRLAWEIRPPVLDELGFVAALDRHIEMLSRRIGTTIDFESAIPRYAELRLSQHAQLGLYRIAQEALTNAIKHAGPCGITVVLVEQPGSVTLVVEDDGVGFDVGPETKDRVSSGLGLLGIRERAAQLGGRVVIESSEGHGTTVKVTVPTGGTS